MDAVATSFIAGGGDYAASLSGAPDHNGLATVFRMIALLDGGKEGIHVQMDYPACHLGIVAGRSMEVESQKWKVKERLPLT
jgi:hypothetical protein